MGNFNSSTNTSTDSSTNTSTDSSTNNDKNSILSLYETNNKFNKILTYDLDIIVSNFIHSMNPDDLKKFSTGDEIFCKNIIIITSEILHKNYTLYQLKNIKNKVKNVYFKHNYHNDTSDEAKNLCLKIAQYYVKIAIIFSTIVNILDPLTKQNNEQNSEEMISLFANNIKGVEKLQNQKINSLENKEIYYSGLCDIRFKYLFDSIEFSNDKITLDKYKLCGLFLDENKDKYPFQNLNIYAVNKLYNDINFSALFSSKKEYEEFFKEITLINIPKSKTPEEVKDNINKLYNKYKNSKNKNNNFKTEFNEFDKNSKIRTTINIDNLCNSLVNYNDNKIIIYNRNNKNVKIYIKHLEKMIINITHYKTELINIINNELFEKINKNESNEKKKIDYIFRVKRDLSIEKLNNLTDYVGKLVFDMYLNCENDYITGIQFLESIIKKDIRDNKNNYQKSDDVDSYNKNKQTILNEIGTLHRANQYQNQYQYQDQDQNQYQYQNLF